MSYQLDVNQVLEALFDSGHPETLKLTQAVEKATQEAATAVAEQLDIAVGVGSFEGIAFAGLCVPFFPQRSGDPLPVIFAENEFDTAEEWNS